MSRQAVYLGHGREAVQLARVAQQGVGSGAPAVVQALLHAAEARGHGLLGEVRACTAALARAERSLDLSSARAFVPTGHASSTRRSSPTSSRTATATCRTTGPRPSTPSARSSCARPAYARSRLFPRTVLAAARLGLGEVDAACALGLEVMQAATEMRSVRAVENDAEVGRRLEPFRDAPPARRGSTSARWPWACAAPADG